MKEESRAPRRCPAGRADIVIAPVGPEEKEQLLRVFVEWFHGREPLTRRIGLEKDRLLALTRSLHLDRGGADSAARGLWRWALDAGRDHAPAGFIVCEDLETAPAGPPQGLSGEERARFPGIAAFLEEVRRPLAGRWVPGKGPCLHVAALGVAPGYEGLGIAARLLESALSRARELGFRHAMSECTGPASRRCHEKCGMVSLHRVSGDAFEFQGTRPLAGLEHECHLMWKALD